MPLSSQEGYYQEALRRQLITAAAVVISRTCRARRRARQSAAPLGHSREVDSAKKRPIGLLSSMRAVAPRERRQSRGSWSSPTLWSWVAPLQNAEKSRQRLFFIFASIFLCGCPRCGLHHNTSILSKNARGIFARALLLLYLAMRAFALWTASRGI